MNSTLKLVSAVATTLCTVSNIYNGSWDYNNQLSKLYNPWKECPKLALNINTTFLRNHLDEYSCVGEPYVEAVYKPSTCHLLSAKSSTRYISMHLRSQKQKRIVYIGDSLIAQLYLSASCFTEHKGPHNSLNTSLITDIFLRNDIPCDDRCITNKTFLNQDKFLHPCWSCRDGIRRYFKDFDTSPSLWHHQIPFKETFAIVINTGAWYNNFKGIINSTFTLGETLNKIGPMFALWKTLHNIQTYWVSLPPHDLAVLSALNESAYGFEWIYFAEKDRIARRILEPHGVTFLDIGNLTLPRKTRDNSSCSDGLHWCNPGVHSVPTFINQALFHLMAVQQLNATARSVLHELRHIPES